ncbi:uncharacterized protein LOC101848326 [Aplysia californica]|uniref:Uncharacterized protein LOC101848326 n=1 Tax=Aplysia californica TaxID=6500 RepID=A0ABM0K7P4_APLCA|nr:uncharacterized protein LOC101848326 [Aplysia californica]
MLTKSSISAVGIALVLCTCFLSARSETKDEKFQRVMMFVGKELSPFCQYFVNKCKEKYNASIELFNQREVCQLILYRNLYGSSHDCLVNAGPCSEDEYSRLKYESCGGAHFLHANLTTTIGVVVITACWLLRGVWHRWM